MYAVGDRVTHKPSGDFGYFVHSFDDEDCLVNFDRAGTSRCAQSDLTKVEVTVIEGVVALDSEGHFIETTDAGDVDADDLIGSFFAENVRITIEKLPKEGK